MAYQYLSKATRLTNYSVIPNDLLAFGLSSTAIVLYSKLLNRANLSIANGRVDKHGRIYILYRLEDLARELEKSISTVKSNMNELVEAGLVEKRRADRGRANIIYVKVPEGSLVGISTTGRKSTVNRTGVKQSTLANYKTVINTLNKTEFAFRHVDQVKLSDAKMFLISLQRNGLGYSSIHNIRGVIRPAFQMVVDDDMILKNPFDFEMGSVFINDSNKREALSPQDQKRFLEFVKNDSHYSRYYDAFLFLFSTGLRISEFCGLTVKDLDFDEEVINVDHQLQRSRSMKYYVESTKTTSGTRKIPMTEEVKELCQRIVANRNKPKREPIIDGYGGFLFFDKEGKPMVALHWEKYIQHARDKYNREHALQLPPITPHICRHTFCSNMARQGMSPKTLQYIMGHSDIAVTMNVYTHLGLDDAREELVRLKEASNVMKIKGVM